MSAYTLYGARAQVFSTNLLDTASSREDQLTGCAFGRLLLPSLTVDVLLDSLEVNVFTMIESLVTLGVAIGFVVVVRVSVMCVYRHDTADGQNVMEIVDKLRLELTSPDQAHRLTHIVHLVRSR